MSTHDRTFTRVGSGDPITLRAEYITSWERMADNAGTRVMLSNGTAICITEPFSQFHHWAISPGKAG